MPEQGFVFTASIDPWHQCSLGRSAASVFLQINCGAMQRGRKRRSGADVEGVKDLEAFEDPDLALDDDIDGDEDIDLDAIMGETFDGDLPEDLEDEEEEERLPSRATQSRPLDMAGQPLLPSSSTCCGLQNSKLH